MARSLKCSSTTSSRREMRLVALAAIYFYLTMRAKCSRLSGADMHNGAVNSKSTEGL